LNTSYESTDSPVTHRLKIPVSTVKIFRELNFKKNMSPEKYREWNLWKKS
jgi:hypothetical protein